MVFAFAECRKGRTHVDESLPQGANGHNLRTRNATTGVGFRHSAGHYSLVVATALRNDESIRKGVPSQSGAPLRSLCAERK